MLHREQEGGRACRAADLGVDVLHVVLGGAWGDDEVLGALPVRPASCGQPEHLDLTVGQSRSRTVQPQVAVLDGTMGTIPEPGAPARGAWGSTPEATVSIAAPVWWPIANPDLGLRRLIERCSLPSLALAKRWIDEAETHRLDDRLQP